jgi:hypothetical protein
VALALAMARRRLLLQRPENQVRFFNYNFTLRYSVCVNRCAAGRCELVGAEQLEIDPLKQVYMETSTHER